MRETRSVFMLAIILISGLFVWHATSNRVLPSNTDCSAGESDDSIWNRTFKTADWGLLNFCDKRKIKSVRLHILDMKASAWGKSGIAGKDGLDVVIETRSTLNLLEHALDPQLSAGPLCFPTTDKTMGTLGGFTSMLLGKVHITTTKDDFYVAILPRYFILNSTSDTMQSAFFSWTLMKLIDDQLFLHTGKHIPLQTAKSLSGERHIAIQQRAYYKQRGEQKLPIYIELDRRQLGLPPDKSEEDAMPIDPEKHDVPKGKKAPSSPGPSSSDN